MNPTTYCTSTDLLKMWLLNFLVLLDLEHKLKLQYKCGFVIFMSSYIQCEIRCTKKMAVQTFSALRSRTEVEATVHVFTSLLSTCVLDVSVLKN